MQASFEELKTDLLEFQVWLFVWLLTYVPAVQEFWLQQMRAW